MSLLCVLFEHAAGYALFKASTEDESEIEAAVHDLESFQSVVELVCFQPFKTGKEALENINCVSEGLLHPSLEEFLVNNAPKSKKKRPLVLGVSEAKLGAAISEKLEMNCSSASHVSELIRGIRFHFHSMVSSFSSVADAIQSQLGLGHHYSRARVKFNVNRIDNMIIQSISLLDQLDKDINSFTMRVREWYSHHFPELIKVVPDNATFVQCLKVVKDRKELAEDCAEQLEEILHDPVKVEKVMEVASSSMGMDISELDLSNVYLFAERITALTDRRKRLQEYLRAKMQSVAPNLAALIGDVVGARLIAHAGSLINLAKYPASTVQILGAEKALFRAIKTKGNTPKYGIIFHSKFIGKAAKSNKGRISRYLANKCSVASRIDCFRDIPTDVFGLKLREQVESRLKFYETGELPPTNIDVMDLAVEEANVADASFSSAKKKKRKRKSGDESMNVSGLELDQSLVEEPPKKKKKKNKESLAGGEEGVNNDASLNETNGLTESGKKKKKKHSLAESMNESVNESLNESVGNGLTESGKKKKKKKKQHNEEEE